MSGRSSPAGDAGGGGGCSSGGEGASLRLTVRKDLFPEPGAEPASTPRSTALDDFGDVSCVKLETDFEQSIDEIAHARRAPPNGVPEKKHRSCKRRKRKRRSSSTDDESDAEERLDNGLLSLGSGRRRRSPRDTRSAQDRTRVTHGVKGGKNLNLVSSSERLHADAEGASAGAEDGEELDSDDEVLKCSVKLPLLRLGAGGGKPYSHSLSQLSSRKRKTERAAPAPPLPPSGKPRSMLGIVASHSKKKSGSRKSPLAATYHSQIVDTNTIKIKIRKANLEPEGLPCSMGDIGQRKCKKKKSSTPVASASSGEEYDPSHGDSAASISVAAPKSRHNPARVKKDTSTKKKNEYSKQSKAERQSLSGPQSVWGSTVPVPVLTKIFEYVIAAQGTLPTALRLGRVCKLWHSVACQPVLWRQVELAPYTRDQWKTDFKLIALLENRLSMCHTLNLAHWKVCNVGCVVACLADYCAGLEELNLTGWSRLTAEHLQDLVTGLAKLKRLDLSLTSEMGGSGTCLSASSMAQFTESMGARLTHLSLANNKFTALQQILTSIATHCSELEVLDISGARATSHPALVPLVALQKGCPKLRVLRVANSQVVLAPATTTQQMEAPGFPCLEELSIAADTGGSGVGEYRLDDEALGRMVRGATRLRLLDLRGLTRISDSGLVRVPAWDLQHLFLGLCNVTRQSSSCLELVCEKWAHSLLEVDLAWASAVRPLDAAVDALADKGADSKLRILNLCGSSVSLEPVKKVLLKCKHLESINLSSCRALPRGMKRLYTGKELEDLKSSLDPAYIKAKEEAERAQNEKNDGDSKSEATGKIVPELESESFQANTTPDPTPPSADPTPTSADLTASTADPTDVSQPHLQANEGRQRETSFASESENKTDKILEGRSPNIKTESPEPKEPADCQSTSQMRSSPKTTNRNWNLDQFSPSMLTGADSSTPLAESRRPRGYEPQESPVPRPDTQTPSQDSSELQQDTHKSGSSWNLEQFKRTPTHKSEASPLGKIDGNSKGNQCSPITSLECKPSPEAVQGVKQDIKNSNNWNYGNYSPMARQDGQYSSHNSPYSAQPSPAQPSPYSAQPSPYSTQPSPYSSQQSPYSAQPSPDTSQMAKPELQKSSGNWNLGGFSPMTKPPSQYSPHPSTHTSPDPSVGLKSDGIRSNPGKTGQFSPMSRQERHHHSPYSPRPSIDSSAGVYTNRKSPGMGNFSPMMRAECNIPSPDGGAASRASLTLRQLESFTRIAPPPPEPVPLLSGAELSAAWALDGFLAGGTGRGTVGAETAWTTPGLLPSHEWGGLPTYDAARAPRDELAERWASLGELQAEPPPMVHNAFLEQNAALDALAAHAVHQFVDENFTESRMD